MSPSDPILSALLIVGDERERPARALHSVLAQDVVDRMEVLLVEISQPGTPPLPGSEHANVRTLRLGPGLPSGQVRAESVRQARAPVVAFIEEHALAQPGWAAAIVAAHRGPWAAVGPEFHTGNSGLGLSDTAALAYYPKWTPPAEYGEYDALPLHDTTYKRDVLLGYGEQLDVLFFPEVLLQWRLHHDGHRLLLEPAIKVVHFYETELGVILRGNYLAARCFMYKRPQVFEWPLWQRVVRFVLSPAIPFTRTARVFWVVVTKRPDRLGLFLRSLIYLLLIYASNAAGEMVGMLLGPGQAEVAYLRNQVSDRRVLPADV